MGQKQIKNPRTTLFRYSSVWGGGGGGVRKINGITHNLLDVIYIEIFWYNEINSQSGLVNFPVSVTCHN